ncbi:MAG: bifunctional oligoribonuclease/PAP phosphatase NrnA [Anaerolineae bacterium]|nr:bifunctional oligoribonuclease/PAP phosphatase NrnA [Anaerolineae bacterium]
MWQKIISIIENNERFVLSSHINPDCDALGSELALAEYLRSLGKTVSIINTDSTAANYRFLDPKQRIDQFSEKRHTRIIKKADVIIVLDASGGWERLGGVGKWLARAEAIKLCIDHHPDATDFVDVAVVDTEASATSELIYELIVAMGGSLSKHIAQALYAAIVTDTGSFRFPKTSPRTHRITAELLAAGADPMYIYRQIYEQNLLEAVQLKGHIMASIQTAANGQIAYYGVSQNTLKQFNVKTSELDGVASLGQLIGGVRVTIFCMELPQDRVKISLRSDGTVTVNQIAFDYGGGGHPSAAGAIGEGSLAGIMAELVAKVEPLLP